MQTLVTVFKTLGFPAAVCAVLLYFCFVTIERNTTAIRALDKSVNILTVIVAGNAGYSMSDFPTSFSDATLKQLKRK